MRASPLCEALAINPKLLVLACLDPHLSFRKGSRRGFLMAQNSANNLTCRVGVTRKGDGLRLGRARRGRSRNKRHSFPLFFAT
jgi:hypothetical protein